MSLLNTYVPCKLRKKIGTDLYGQAKLGPTLNISCAPVKVQRISQHTTVRADSSASRGYADEYVVKTLFLFPAPTKLQIGDQITVQNITMKVIEMDPRSDLFGRLDHYEVRCDVWA